MLTFISQMINSYELQERPHIIYAIGALCILVTLRFIMFALHLISPIQHIPLVLCL